MVLWILILFPVLNINSQKTNFLRCQSICNRNGTTSDIILLLIFLLLKNWKQLKRAKVWTMQWWWAWEGNQDNKELYDDCGKELGKGRKSRSQEQNLQRNQILFFSSTQRREVIFEELRGPHCSIDIIDLLKVKEFSMIFNFGIWHSEIKMDNRGGKVIRKTKQKCQEKKTLHLICYISEWTKHILRLTTN